MNAGVPAASNVSARILRALRKREPLRRFLCALCPAAEAAGGQPWIVGGFLRDRIEGLPGGDLDLVITGVGLDRLGRLLRRLPAKRLGIRRIVRAGKTFPVYKVRATWSDGEIDVAPPRCKRTKEAGDGERRGSAGNAEAWEDASLRDFTMNAILFRIRADRGRFRGELFDPFDGTGDLRRMRIRGVGNPSDRFREDPLRILRAIRQKHERPGFSIEKDTWTALRREAESFPGTLPGERIFAELSRSLSANPVGTVTDLHRTGILARLLPEIPDWGSGPLARTKRRYRVLEESLGRPLPELLLLAALLADLAEREGRGPALHLPRTERAARRLHFPRPRDVVRILTDLLRLGRLRASDTPRARAEAIFSRRKDPEALLALYSATERAASRGETDFRPMLRKAGRTPRLLAGDELLAMGVPEGPRVEEILLQVREATLTGAVATRNQARDLAAGLLARKGTARSGHRGRNSSSRVSRSPISARTSGRVSGTRCPRAAISSNMKKLDRSGPA